MNIKVCGITTEKQLQQLEGMGIDLAGIIFDENSQRYVGEKINPKEVIDADLDLKKVGVFVEEDYETIMEKVEHYGLDVVQLHGEHSPELCEEISEDVEVIKVFKLSPGEKIDIDKLVAPFDAVCDYYLFDTKGAQPGGNGEKFDWDVLKKAKIEKPFFLSGGIGLEDIAAIKKFKHPDFFGVDLNSKFEKEPGIKDMGKVLEFKLAFK